MRIASKYTTAAIAAVTAGLSASPASAAFLFDFSGQAAEGNPFDTAGVGANATVTDGSDSVKLTTVDVRAPEYVSGAATGVTLSAAAGANVLTNVGFGQTSLGINNPSISDSAFQAAFGPSGESSNFNQNEAWVFEFDTAVTVEQFDFASLDAADQFTVTVEGVATPFVFNDDGGTADVYDDPFNGLLIPAGSDVTLTSTGAIDGIVRIASLTVAVPEPASVGLLGGAMLALVARRRRHA